MASVAGARSTPASLFASACTYQVLLSIAPGKSACTVTEPELPRVADEPLQNRGSNVALITIGTVLVRAAPHRSAAYCRATRRCSPSVVPGLPPTGVAG